MSRKKKNPVVAQNVFKCQTCKSEEMSYREMFKHLHDAHGMAHERIAGNRRMLSHVDAADWYGSCYAWEFSAPAGKVELIQNIVSPRGKE